MNSPSFDYDMASEGDGGGGGGNFVAQLPVMLWQRKWWIIVPALIGIIGGLLAAVLIPPVYRSNAIMLVESAQLPDEVLGFEGTDVIDRRIAAIRQQITARTDLIELIERHGLYNSQRRTKPLSEVLETMRSAITLIPSQTTTTGRSSNQKTIAFELAFEYNEPIAAQVVAQDLMDRVLQLDARGNARQATNTVQFLTDQASGLETQIADLQGRISQINGANGSVLAGTGTIVNGNSGSYDIQIAALQRENQLLVQQRSVAQSSDTRDPVVVAAEQRLAAARAVYADTHPDVVFAKQALAQARQLAKSNSQKLPLDTIDQQIAFNNSQISSLRAARSSELAQINSRLSAQSRAPLVQQQLGELQQLLTSLNTRYDGVQAKLMAARAGVRAEDEQMAERLSVVEPPVVPDRPSWPNRLLLAAIGIIGGLGLGMALALAVELIVRPIRHPGALHAIFGEPPLGIVPVIETKTARAVGWRRWFEFLPSFSTRKS